MVLPRPKADAIAQCDTEPSQLLYNRTYDDNRTVTLVPPTQNSENITVCI